MSHPIVPRTRVGVLISGGGTNLQALIDAAAVPDFPAEIVLVISNMPAAGGFQRASAAGIATLVINHQDFDGRAPFDEALNKALQSAGCQIVCLAGFMRILTPIFISGWAGQILNIHPSLLPSFPGLHTHHRAIDASARVAGCTTHLVTPELDSGPILAQAVVPILADDTTDTLAARVLKQEHRIYPQTLRLLAEGRIRIVDGRAVIDDQAPPDGVILVNPAIV
jgi:phosphoribosylglycinamide formyltransferase-1